MYIPSKLLTAIGLAAALIVSSAAANAAAGPASDAAASADDSGSDVAKKLQNPVSNLISVPIENNFDFGGGANGDRYQYRLQVQPVIPVSISENWNLISRTIFSYVDQTDALGRSHQSGLGDTTESLFLSPKAPTSNGWIWGAGSVLLLPTATDNRLGAEKWGAGPTFVVLKQANGWTYGALVNQIWSIGGPNARGAVSATFLEPFLNYTTQSFTTFGIQTESTYDWQARQWTVPIIATVSKLVKIGGRPISFLVGARYYPDKAAGGPDWGLRTTVTLLFPK
jgi:hypothetical protein